MLLQVVACSLTLGRTSISAHTLSCADLTFSQSIPPCCYATHTHHTHHTHHQQHEHISHHIPSLLPGFFLMLPTPSCPWVLRPQHHDSPLSSTTAVWWRPPHAACIFVCVCGCGWIVLCVDGCCVMCRSASYCVCPCQCCVGSATTNTGGAPPAQTNNNKQQTYLQRPFCPAARQQSWGCCAAIDLHGPAALSVVLFLL